MLAMLPLKIDGTKRSPMICLDPESQTYIISGNCYLENVIRFFRPLMNWLEQYKKELQKNNSINNFTFKFSFSYFNSATFKYLIQILKKLKEFEDIGTKITIIWLYEADDDDMKDSGFDLIALSNINISFITQPISD